MLFDSHAHLDDSAFDGDRAEVIARAAEAGVSHILQVGTSPGSNRHAVELSAKHEGIWCSVGIHPHDADGITEDQWQELSQVAKCEKVVAIGEIGLDYFRNYSPRDVQQAAFRRQLQLAQELDLPAIVHCRDAFRDCLRILKEEADGLRGVMHCFSGDEKAARQCLELGFFISFAGQISYPKSVALRKAAATIPTDRLMVETDCPYLAPQPKRGRRNEPAFVRYTAETLAEVLGLAFDDVARTTTRNAQRLFGLEAAVEDGETP